MDFLKRGFKDISTFNIFYYPAEDAWIDRTKMPRQKTESDQCQRILLSFQLSEYYAFKKKVKSYQVKTSQTQT